MAEEAELACEIETLRLRSPELGNSARQLDSSALQFTSVAQPCSLAQSVAQPCSSPR